MRNYTQTMPRQIIAAIDALSKHATNLLLKPLRDKSQVASGEPTRQPAGDRVIDSSSH